MYMRPPLLPTRAIEAKDLNDHEREPVIWGRHTIIIILEVEGTAVLDRVLSQ